MTTPRPSLTPKQKLTIMARFCRCPGLPERGVECGKRLPTMAECEFDHAHARALGGTDDLDNYRPLCPGCHAFKTFGRRGEKTATTAGSDIATIAKVKRLTADHEAARRRMLAKDAGEPKQKSRWGSRPFPKRKRTVQNG